MAERAIWAPYLAGRAHQIPEKSRALLLEALEELRREPIRSDDVVVLSPGIYRQQASSGPPYWDDKWEAQLQTLVNSGLRLRILRIGESMPVLCAIYLALADVIRADWRRRPYGTILILPPGTPLDRAAFAHGVDRDFKTRCVPFDREVAGMPAVMIDDASPIEKGIGKALAKGYESFVVLGGPRADRTSERRVNAAIGQLEKSTVPWIVFRAKERLPGYPVDEASGEFRRFDRYLREHVYSRKRGTAIVTANSHLAESAHKLVTDTFGRWPAEMTIVQGGDELRESRLEAGKEWHQGSRQRIDDEVDTVLRQLMRLREGQAMGTVTVPVEYEESA